ncbi:hypothetical protein ARMSODRAFT_1026241 [Armillaria solidipes]|uniref:Uncharacterized protein n=1 Tax=Armillaria solidipes TaxID=1076256 RepID=A0A2H3AVP5_9AGAR|nr:hypothetical protein ARMSODRAFT_1026241 [Armillaria solidipes]
MSTSISQDQSKTIFKASDLVLNSTLLEAFLHGMYTIVFLSGIAKCHNTLLTASVLAFVVNGVTEMATYQSLLSTNYKWMWAVSGICVCANILLADCILAWVVWNWDLKVVIILIISAILEIVFSGFFLYQDISHSSSNTT